jgi:hypothetical protein
MLADMPSDNKPDAFVVTGIKTSTCIACQKETDVFEILFQGRTILLCPRDFFKQVRIVCAAAPPPLQSTPRTS